VDFFPFDTLEAQVAKPERWTPTPNDPSAKPLGAAIASVQLSKPSSSSLEPHPASHMTVPKINSEANPLKKIDLSTALQYGTADGYPPLRSFVRQFTRNHLHPTVPYLNGPEVILTSGSTDGFSKAVELIVEPWRDDKDPVENRPAMLCEVFVYMNGPATVKPKGVRLVPVEIDDEGMMAHGPGGLQDIMENWDFRDGRRPHFIYTVTCVLSPEPRLSFLFVMI
jgi:DNA-binding transcriptional MocR family regulator